MPGTPPLRLAACWPVSMPCPAASMPSIATSGSSRKGRNSPIAFEPPPTAAISRPGRRPSALRARAPVGGACVRRVLGRLRAAGDGPHLGAEQLHAEDIGLLAGDVDRAHEH